MKTEQKTGRLPRIALMGEFSAGKSTLANLLLGQDVSPVKVTATQLPPIWYSLGARGVQRVDAQGQEIAIAPEALGDVSHDETQALRIQLGAEVLEFCDLIDMPGTSDPNMPQQIWDRMLAHTDGVIWCTPATQAWRQSEAALWDQLPGRLHDNSLLLITRMDKLLTQRDRDRVLARVRREAGNSFAAVLPISLTQALADPENPEVLERCGADSFVEALIELVEKLGLQPSDADMPLFAPIRQPEVREMPRDMGGRAPASVQVQPRRIVPKRPLRAPGAAHGASP